MITLHPVQNVLSRRSQLMIILGLGTILIAYLAGMFVNLMDVDSAQYGAISVDLYENGDWTRLRDRDQDYLDKPPLTFWCAAASFHLFGISNFSFHLPSVLFSLLAVYSVFRIGQFFYSSEAGLVAALVTACSQAFFTMNLDVKTDMYLTGSVMFATWQLVRFTRGNSWTGLILGALGMSAGMLAKGPLGVVIPLLAIGADLVLRRDWKNLFSWKWLIALFVFAIPLIPFCIGLYKQFGGEGVKFFFWTQSFGRISGESGWENNTTVFYLVHTFLWACLPWTLFLLPVLFREIKNILNQRLKISFQSEAVAISGFLFTFAGLSLSKFKLPHYIFVVMPFFGIMLGSYMVSALASSGKLKFAIQLQNVLIGFLSLAGIFLLYLAFPGSHWGFLAVFLLVWLLGVYGLMLMEVSPFKLILPSVFFFSAANLSMNIHLYPSIQEYQSQVRVIEAANEMNIPLENFFSFEQGGHTLDFYARRIVLMIPDAGKYLKKAEPTGFYVYTNDNGLNFFQNQPAAKVEILKVFPHFNPAKLNLKFLNPATRNETLSKRYLLHIIPNS